MLKFSGLTEFSSELKLLPKKLWELNLSKKLRISLNSVQFDSKQNKIALKYLVIDLLHEDPIFFCKYRI